MAEVCKVGGTVSVQVRLSLQAVVWDRESPRQTTGVFRVCPRENVRISVRVPTGVPTVFLVPRKRLLRSVATISASSRFVT